MMRLVFRHNRWRLLAWAVVITGMIPLVNASQRAMFPTPADREAYAAIASNPLVAALTGTPYAADTFGGILVLKIWMTLALTLVLSTIFLVTRNGRSEEESGRTELLRANVQGRHTYTLAGWFVVAAYNVSVGILVSGAAVALGLPADGSLVLGASLAALGLFFLGVSAVMGQLFPAARGANGAAAAVLGVAYVLRAIGDLEGNGTAPGWTSLLSPIGWAQQMRAFGENRWWPLVPLVLGAVLLCGVAMAVEARRDLGTGVLPVRPGPAAAGRFLATPFGLSLRLQRGPIIGWFATVLVMAWMYGSVASAMADLLGTNTVFITLVGRHGTATTSGVLMFLSMLNAIAVNAFVVESALQLRTEEATGRAEAQLAGSLSRLRWAWGRLLVTVIGSILMLVVGGTIMGAAYGASRNDPSQLWVLAGLSLFEWPSVMVTAGVVVLLIGVVPRQAAALSWCYFGVSSIVSMFGLPLASAENMLFTATAAFPADSLVLLTLAALTAIAVALWAIGLVRFARRDLAPGT
ncbi:ABC transporter permease [Paeniglutamicibacter sp. NPDC091659]|uniref:ABC transporter permease n=1 Tax=Paeniglutamicibacter sp. NPDC091659 TaxID=3364389 RepID=UPI003826E1AA